MKDMSFEQFCEMSPDTLLFSYQAKDGTQIAVIQLMYHVALYINPVGSTSTFSYDHRYCYANLAAAKKACELYDITHQWLLYQKDHCNNISVINGLLFKAGDPPLPKFSLGGTGWHEKRVKQGDFSYYYVESNACADKLWIHKSDGSSVGRFSLTGFDIVQPLDKKEDFPPLHISGSPVTQGDFATFVKYAERHWSIVLRDTDFNTSLLTG